MAFRIFLLSWFLVKEELASLRLSHIIIFSLNWMFGGKMMLHVSCGAVILETSITDLAENCTIVYSFVLVSLKSKTLPNFTLGWPPWSYPLKLVDIIIVKVGLFSSHLFISLILSFIFTFFLDIVISNVINEFVTFKFYNKRTS